MDQSVTISTPTTVHRQPARIWLPQAALLAYLGLVVVAMIVLALLAFNWLSLPYAGIDLGPTLIIYDVPAGSPAFEQGLRAGSLLSAINGTPLHTPADFTNAMRGLSSGDIILLQAITLNASVVSAQVSAGHLPLNRAFTLVYAPFLVSLVYLASAVWTFSVRRARSSGQMLTLFCASMAVILAGLPSLYTSQVLMGFWSLALGLAGAAIFNLSFLFPREAAFLNLRRWVLILAFIPGVLLALVSWLGLAGQLPQVDLSSVWKIQVGLLCAATIFTFAWVALRGSRAAVATEREQLRFAVLSGVASYAPIVLWMAYHLGAGSAAVVHAAAILPMAIFPVVISYIVQRFRLQKADYILSRVVLYGILAVLIGMGYALLVTGLSLVAGQVLPSDNPLVIGLSFFILALAIQPLRARLQHTVDTIFFRGEAAYQERLGTFSGALTRMVDLNGILKVLRQYITDTLTPSRLHIYILDPLSDTYASVKGISGTTTSDVRFSASSPLVQTLSRQDGPLNLAEPNSLPPAFQADKSRLILLGTSVFTPLPGRERLNGWVAMSERVTADPYTTRELNYLEALCDQAALAIERAQVMADMENRVLQMNVLARVAQGVNITLSMDDLLELIYAQTVQILPADELHIMLHDPVQDIFQYVFFLENDERLTEHENHPIVAGEALEQEVIRQGLPIRSSDYNRECQRRGIAAPRPNLYGWMAVPLNAGAKTIGALSLGIHDPYVGYTADQQQPGPVHRRPGRGCHRQGAPAAGNRTPRPAAHHPQRYDPPAHLHPRLGTAADRTSCRARSTS